MEGTNSANKGSKQMADRDGSWTGRQQRQRPAAGGAAVAEGSSRGRRGAGPPGGVSVVDGEAGPAGRPM